jgi:hypothetical protein
MASFNQDFIKFEDDTFLLLYTFTDLTSNFDTNWEAWWGCSESEGEASVLQKCTSVWGTGMPVAPFQVVIPNGGTQIQVFFTQADFANTTGGVLVTNTTYYTELVVSPTGNENTSLVAAVGTFIPKKSIFTSDLYRPL